MILVCDSCGNHRGDTAVTDEGIVCLPCREGNPPPADEEFERVGELADRYFGSAPRESRLDQPPAISVRDFLAIQRPAVAPLVASEDGRSILLGEGSMLGVAGPSGLGKSLAAYDLAGLLASPQGGSWLGLNVTGGHRVLLIPFPGEGSDEDIAERLGQLIPHDAQVSVWDHWRGEPAPKADDDGVASIAAEVIRTRSDVVMLDTAPKFFGGTYDITKGIPETAVEALSAIRRRVDWPIAFVLVLHTRKMDRSSNGTRDELEEIAGAFGKNLDGAVVLRRDGEDRGPRRRVTFAKVRRGPDLDGVIVTFPGRDSTDPPRLTVVKDLGGAQIKEGTDAEAIAAWVRSHPTPVAAAVISAKFDLSDSTLRRRAQQMVEHGIERHKIPGRGNAYGYGTDAQWLHLHTLDLEAQNAEVSA